MGIVPSSVSACAWKSGQRWSCSSWRDSPGRRSWQRPSAVGSHPFSSPLELGQICARSRDTFTQGSVAARGSWWEVNRGPAAACSSLLLLSSCTQRPCCCLGWAFPPLILSNVLEFSSGIHLRPRRDAQHKPFPPATPKLSRFWEPLRGTCTPPRLALLSPVPARGQAHLSLSQVLPVPRTVNLGRGRANKPTSDPPALEWKIKHCGTSLPLLPPVQKPDWKHSLVLGKVRPFCFGFGR